MCTEERITGSIIAVGMDFWEVIPLGQEKGVVALHFHEGKGQRCCSQKCATQACERHNFTAQRPRASWSTKADWSENNQSEVFCGPEQGLLFSGIVKNASCCCYEHVGGCQVTASIFGLCASQISSKLVGFLHQINGKNYLTPQLETTETKETSWALRPAHS